MDDFDDPWQLMHELQRQFMLNQKWLAARTRELASIRLKTGEELNSYFACFDMIVAELNLNLRFTVSEGVCETLLLEGQCLRPAPPM